MIIIIDNYDSFTYNLYQYVAAHQHTVKVIRHDQKTVADIHALQPKGIILSPGPGRPENAGICVALIQSLSTKSIHLLGVCLGHQAIVTAFGGQVIPAPEIMHGEDDHIFHTRHSLFESMTLPFAAGRYHSLIACKKTSKILTFFGILRTIKKKLVALDSPLHSKCQ